MTRKKRTVHLRHKKWAYQNTTFFVASIVVFLIVAETPLVRDAIHHVASYGYMGAAIAGAFFVSTFTIIPATAVIYQIATEFNPYLVALAAGVGAVLGDLLIYRFFKDSIFKELRPLFERFGGSRLTALLHSPHFAWFTPVLGAFVIALPVLPDELGIGLMGLSKVKEWQFVILSYVLNVSGILLITLFASA